MKFEEFAEKMLSDNLLMLELVHKAFVAQIKIKDQLASGVMEKSRTEYDSLMDVFEGVEKPFNWSSSSWANEFTYYRGRDF